MPGEVSHPLHMVHRAHDCDHHPLALSTRGLARQHDDVALLQFVERRSHLITVRDDDVSKCKISLVQRDCRVGQDLGGQPGHPGRSVISSASSP